MTASDVLVLAPWALFGVGLILFYIWLRGTPHPSGHRSKRSKNCSSTSGSKPGPDHGARSSSSDQAADGERHETTLS